MDRIHAAHTDVNHNSKVVPVAASQTILKGDIVVLDANGAATKGAVGATTIYGFAEHDITTDASGNTTNVFNGITQKADGYSAPHRGLIVTRARAVQSFRGDLKNGSTQTTVKSGDLVGFIVENGYTKLDPAAVVKQAKITSVQLGSQPYGGDAQIVANFKIIAANRFED